MKRARWFVPAMLVLTLLLVPATRAPAQALEQVPSDALMVIKVNRLAQTSGKLASLARKFGLDQMVPFAADPLAAAKQQLGIKGGVNDAGDVVFALLPKTGQGRGGPEMVVFIPVSDYKAFVESFPESTTQGALTSLKLPMSPMPVFAAQRGGYAALSVNQQLLAQAPAKALSASGPAAGELDKKDIVMYANMPALKEQAMPALENRARILDEIERGMARGGQQANEKYKPLVRAVVNQGLDMVEQFLQQSQAGIVGLDLSDDGIVGTGMMQFDPASEWGKTVAQVKSTNDKLVSGIPQEPYLLVGGYSLDPQVLTKFINDLAAPAEKELANLGDEGKAVIDYISSIKAIIQSMKGQSFGMLVPTGQLGQEGLFKVVSVTRGDAKKILAQQEQLVKQQDAFTKMTGGGIEMKSTFTPNAKTIDGVQLNEVKMAMTPGAAPGADNRQQQEMQQMLSMMYGPNGMSGYMGAVGDDKLIAGMSVSDEILSKLVAAAKADAPVNIAGADVVAKHLPAERSLVWYLPLDVLAKAISSYSPQLGMPINLQLPENLPPLAGSAGTQQSAIRGDVFIPADTIQAIIAAFMQMQMRQQGGPGQPPPAPAENN